MRLREAGLKVLGFGEQKTPEAFRNACHRFLLTELLRPPAEMPGEPPAASSPRCGPSGHRPAAPPPTGGRFRSSSCSKRSRSRATRPVGPLGTFGHYLTKLQPDFDGAPVRSSKAVRSVRARTDLFVVESGRRQAPQRRNCTFTPRRRSRVLRCGGRHGSHTGWCAQRPRPSIKLRLLMKIDIDKLTEAELVDLNHRIVERLRFLHQLRSTSRCSSSGSASGSSSSPKGVPSRPAWSPATTERP